MQNKTNRWLEVQIVITTLALTYGLVLWNFFAGGSRALNTGVAPSAQSPIIPASAPQFTGRIFFGGMAPGSAPSFTAPAPVAVTGSSRP
jgi:hypothetical protein